ncbi:50S ribosomal protein L29 [Nitrosophilus kaiyonis]|uniref:50S ribosomal protein L29 n=1 Tax=Nitrosophilus kaiyonis TaxID=2930200 RepID=UPI00249045CB|nr:50S ribosomal protein L29 [Nitrosophilus kaiyonis]
MKYTEIKDKSLQELEGMLRDKKLLLFQLRAKLKTMQLQDTSEIRKTRRDIARIKTAIAAKKRA